MNPLQACAANRINSAYSAQRARPAADDSRQIAPLDSIAPAAAQNPADRRQPITERPPAAAPASPDCSSSTNYTPSKVKTPDKAEDFWSKPDQGVPESDSSQDDSLPFLRSDGPLHLSLGMGWGLKLGLDGQMGFNFGPGLKLF